MSAILRYGPAALVSGTLAALALVPLLGSDYHVALAVAVLSYIVLATAWALFSGPTGYVSLATVAFFGIGAYTVAVLGEVLPWPVVLLVAALIGLVVALVVGLSTLRLSGIYFVVFSFGLAELIRQLVTWYEVNVGRSVGRYVFLDIGQTAIFWQLFGLAVAVFVVGWLVRRSRLGLALQVIGEDETVARHCGIDTTRAKLALFAVSSVFITVTGAVMAPRWTYIDPAIAFNPLVSFQVVVMALLGGAGVLYGPLLGAVPLVLLFDVIGANFPNHFSILLGLVFVVVVYGLPRGVAGLLGRANSIEHRAGPPSHRVRGEGGSPRSGETGEGASRGYADAPSPGSHASSVRSDLSPRAGRRETCLDVSGEPLLEIVDLSKSFGGVRAVDGVSFQVARGSIVGLIGPNGSGKTTALNLISGLIPPRGGAIRFDGAEITGLRSDRIVHRGIARTFQLVRVLDELTCADNVMAAIAFRRHPSWGEKARHRAATLLARVGLAGRDEEPAGRLTYIDSKRLELARALALDPKLLLLDEWLAGLNPTELQEGIALIASLKRDGLTIVMVEHVMDAIRSLCDRCVVMNTGRTIADGGTAEVLAAPEVVRAYLGGGDADD
ncbi:branched-chain amino acid ABC transporter ATP-binding protein/permease [Rhodoplanes sp. TEM]|uniref:Branched-chain amino acid ABC transporter ATP-binding protein/permease n=1 Tax=Rhodoplanes tepidamans TaxID=200616 RepID=A0ABT5JF06_RHOTP|nr:MULTISPECIES: branched-chain amino acid ABC transporter ATP-binding protein/permease [Rhodoplanes]MDC7787640.1 branched-chain amino acid ABC transporter ATP-binding protein/permease [Rhodoplanes tepidamans]MDC7984544.1 branched-chain amino acid ABC transporter ATP-binding protein/permease [Rhodoplanes sp. TEM]MDQ0355209.1 branched-chain amino acid transport system permease protein [Rhodoplanes tepidamans]